MPNFYFDMTKRLPKEGESVWNYMQRTEPICPWIIAQVPIGVGFGIFFKEMKGRKYYFVVRDQLLIGKFEREKDKNGNATLKPLTLKEIDLKTPGLLCTEIEEGGLTIVYD